MNGEKIEKVRIRDEDVADWTQGLREAGLNNEEIDDMLAELNRTYAKQKGIDFVERELERVENYFLGRYKHPLTDEQKKYFRKAIKAKLEKEEKGK